MPEKLDKLKKLQEVIKLTFGSVTKEEFLVYFDELNKYVSSIRKENEESRDGLKKFNSEVIKGIETDNKELIENTLSSLKNRFTEKISDFFLKLEVSRKLSKILSEHESSVSQINSSISKVNSIGENANAIIKKADNKIVEFENNIGSKLTEIDELNAKNEDRIVSLIVGRIPRLEDFLTNVTTQLIWELLGVLKISNIENLREELDELKNGLLPQVVWAVDCLAGT